MARAHLLLPPQRQRLHLLPQPPLQLLVEMLSQVVAALRLVVESTTLVEVQRPQPRMVLAT